MDQDNIKTSIGKPWKAPVVVEGYVEIPVNPPLNYLKRFSFYIIEGPTDEESAFVSWVSEADILNLMGQKALKKLCQSLLEQYAAKMNAEHPELFPYLNTEPVFNPEEIKLLEEAEFRKVSDSLYISDLPGITDGDGVIYLAWKSEDGKIILSINREESYNPYPTVQDVLSAVAKDLHGKP